MVSSLETRGRLARGISHIIRGVWLDWYKVIRNNSQVVAIYGKTKVGV